ncbi:hypothetical protein [Streptomyces prasinus]|uniref:hypothetical protein n=1 Tax=Streptomyces prasinus TaxID=67345 RepID=UPI00368A6E7A
MVTVAGVTCVRHAVTGVRVLTPVSAVGVVTQGIGVDPAVPVMLGRRIVRDLPGVIVPRTLHAWMRSVLVSGCAHRFLSGQPVGGTPSLIPQGGISESHE